MSIAYAILVAVYEIMWTVEFSSHWHSDGRGSSLIELVAACELVLFILLQYASQ